MSLPTTRTVVVGAGPAGLAAALGLAQDGHAVVLLEPDRPVPDLPLEVLTAWTRPGAPHVRQAHNLMPLAHLRLREAVPDVVAELLRLGAHEVDLRAQLPAGAVDAERERDLVALACRRVLLDRVLRAAVQRDRRVELRTCRALEVLPDGVLTDRGPVRADLVVDAAGRRSPLPAALLRDGHPVVRDAHDCVTGYLTRYYRLPSDVAPTPLRLGLALRTDLRHVTAALFRGDGDVLSISLGVRPEDRELRRALSTPAGFDAAVARLPQFDRWLEAATPLTGVLRMSGLQNALVRTGPLPLPYVGVGDTVLTTDPQFGWGVGLALSHVALLREVLARAGGGRPVDVAADVRARVVADSAPRWRAACEDDRLRRTWWDGGGFTPPPGLALGWAGRDDRDLAVTALRRLSALDLPDAHLDRPGVPEALARARAHLQPPEGPTRADLLAAARSPAAQAPAA